MRRDAWAKWFVPRAKRYWPELLLAVLALASFLGCLGSVELWGKREQRAAAEAIDTVDHNHWLVAEIQGRPRLEKPPLPRWSIAALMKITGCRAEWIVRLPSAISGVLTVALIYALGLRMGGREIALASSLVLCSLGFFVGEMRQASNDTLLALFTTLALYAAWRMLEPAKYEAKGHSGTRSWGLVFYTALALGFLTKGPVVLLLVAVTIIPYLVFDRRLKSGLAALVSGVGLAVFVLVGSSWPIAVLIENPAAAQVWLLEMSEKTGLSQILEHRRHALLVADWPGMVLPWTLIALAAVILPFCHAKLIPARERSGDPGSRPRPWAFLWFAWWWGVGNLAAFCFWSVAKPNYYVPCLPGMALLIGSTWVLLARAGRGRRGRVAIIARGILQTQWVLMFVGAVVAPVVVRERVPEDLWPWCAAIAAALAIGISLSVLAWRKGATALALAPFVSACVIGLIVAYGRIAPVENPARSHRALAEQIGQIVPEGLPTVMFFNEIDEGLWFYADGFALAPIPGSHPRFNTAFDLALSYVTERHHSESLSALEARRQAHEKQALFRWLERSHGSAPYLLIRGNLYDRFAADLAGFVKPVLRETGMKRNELVLLEVTAREPISVTASQERAAAR